MIQSEIIKKSIDYILQHLDESISIEDVANYCHFSKFHFSRVFKAETGESLYAFIKRLRMEQSAIRLKLEKSKCITDIGIDYGYSASNYSSAFKKHLHQSPAEFRQNTNAISILHPFYPDSMIRFQTFDEYDREVQIKELDDFPVIYERHLGNYIQLGENWYQFLQKYQDLYREDTLLIEKFYDDPAITRVDQCLYDICMTVEKDCALNNVTTIRGGKFAVYRYEGSIRNIFTAFQGVFNIWLAGSTYEMDERYGLDIYRSIDWESSHVVTDLCIPVK